MHRRCRRVRATRARPSRGARPARHCTIRDFRPSAWRRFPDLQIELSLLSPPEPVLPENIEMGKHGLLISQGVKRGLLLPQVAVEHHLGREQFLGGDLSKSGLAANAWQEPETQILGFICEVFSEEEEVGERSSRRCLQSLTQHCCLRCSVCAKKRPARGTSRSGPEVSILPCDEAIRVRRNRRCTCRCC